MAADLYPRIRAAIEERLELARAATRGPWKHIGRNWIHTGPIDVTEADYGAEGHDSYFIHTNEGPGAWRVEDAAFIAANHPAWAIRALEADLSRLDQHQPCIKVHTRAEVEFANDVMRGIRYDHSQPVCHRCMTDAACEEIKLLARVYLEEEP